MNDYHDVDLVAGELLKCKESECPVFDGKVLHKSAWPNPNKKPSVPTKKHAALILGKAYEDHITVEQGNKIIERINLVKKVFEQTVSTYVENWWLQNAKRLKMKISSTGKSVGTYKELVKELASNPTMESFQNWYKICYKDTEIKSGGKEQAEREILKKLNIKYNESNVKTGGCVGDLVGSVMGKMVEKIAAQSRATQFLHLTKSKPKFSTNKEQEVRIGGPVRRSIGDYYIIRSDRNGKLTNDYKLFNVSTSNVGYY
jgi:hypothetical protein